MAATKQRTAIKKRLFVVLLGIFIVVMVGTNGYYMLYGGHSKFLDCMYMTVISLTGVGYGEVLQVTGNVPAQIFTMVLITFGMGVIYYGISAMTALIVEGELSGILKRQRMQKDIRKMKGHYIVCGGGETGRPLISELLSNREAVVLIEQDRTYIDLVRDIGDVPYIEGDATEDQNLIAAGIENAAGIVVCLPSDKDCLYVTMTARMLNRKLRIISRMADQKHEAKLRIAGADGVVSPNAIGALRMASEMIRPTAVDFLDQMLRSSGGTLRFNQLRLSETGAFSGRSIGESGIKDKYRLLIVGLKEEGGSISFNPPPTTVLKCGMKLIVMGDVADIQKAKKAC
ncbi:TrkA-N domain protein [delta proteobacterium NaphS2]|nr:TrkA-N domain protein [delta proteobacterium NaphS2]